MPPGPASVCLTSGSGNLPRKAGRSLLSLGQRLARCGRAGAAEGRTLAGPDNVDAHPQGTSPFGVVDLVGNVWQWTDEYLDEHTRAGILRGGSYYRPQVPCGTFRKPIATTNMESYC